MHGAPELIYRDESLLAVSKPSGWLSIPDRHDAEIPSVRKWMEAKGEKVFVVHRIDKDTSGLLLIAKEETAMMKLARQFFEHSVERTYQALVWGRPEPESGTINQRLARSPRDRRLTEVTQNEEIGKHAITHYSTLETFSWTSLVQCKLETGRTHQIRAHLRWLGHPLFADEMYGGRLVVKGPGFSSYKAFVENAFQLCPRQALHAKTLGFKHPVSGEWLQFDSELPPDMQAVIAKWRAYNP